MACANCATHDRAGIRVDSAGNVESEDRDAERVELLDQRAVSSGKRALQSGAEQAVDGEIEARFSRDAVKERPSRGFPFFQRHQRIFRQLAALPGKNDVDAKEPAFQVRRDLEGIAAVVARPGQYENALGRVAAQAARVFRSGRAGPFHERAGCGCRQLFQLAHRWRRVDGERGHGAQ